MDDQHEELKKRKERDALGIKDQSASTMLMVVSQVNVRVIFVLFISGDDVLIDVWPYC